MENSESENHAANLLRFSAIEKELAENTRITKMLVESTSDLLEMWGDAGVFFKWMRRFGALLVWIGKVAAAIAALWGIGHYWGPK
jgi:hypothetical protein